MGRPRRKPEVIVAKVLEVSDVLLWEQQLSEPDEAWEWFQRYRDMPRPRAVSRVRGHQLQKLLTLYEEYRWKERCAAYDRYLDKVRRDEIEAAVRMDARDTAAEHMAVLRDARELAGREMQKLLEASKGDDMPGLVRPAELIKLIETVIKFDRLLNNQSTDNVEHVITDMTKLSNAELRQYEELQRKVLGSGNKT